MVRRLIVESERLYLRSEAGITKLPVRCRPGIFAARFIYAGIAGAIREQSYQTITNRAFTSKRQKISWVGLSVLRTMSGFLMPQSAVVYAKPLQEVQFLVDAATEGFPEKPEWSDKLFGAMEQLRSIDRTKYHA